jgi:hypothetical protein
MLQNLSIKFVYLTSGALYSAEECCQDILINVFMLSVILLNVVAPFYNANE